VLRVVDITEISAVVAAAGVLVGVAYYILDMRNQTKLRQSDLLMRMHLAFSSRERCDATLKMGSANYEDFDDFVKKYGHPFAEGPVQTEFLMMSMFFEGIGVLAKKKLVDIDLVAELFSVNLVWEKVKPIAEGLRKQLNTPKVYEWFEYLSNETKKRQYPPYRTA